MTELPAIDVPEGAFCATHPEAPAILICQRCGNYVGVCCVASIDRAEFCKVCVARIPRRAGLARRLGAGFIDTWLVLGVLSNGSTSGTVSAADGAATSRALFAFCFALGVFVLNSLLIASRAQTLGMLFCGVRFAMLDGTRAGTARLLLMRWLAPTVALLGTSFLPMGIPLAAAVNFGCMRPTQGRTLVDLATKTLVVRSSAASV